MLLNNKMHYLAPSYHLSACSQVVTCLCPAGSYIITCMYTLTLAANTLLVSML